MVMAVSFTMDDLVGMYRAAYLNGWHDRDESERYDPVIDADSVVVMVDEDRHEARCLARARYWRRVTATRPGRVSADAV